jgi:hypothetical protein
MNKAFYFICFFSIATISWAQSDFQAETINDSIDTKYKEDQFYFGVTYNVLGNMPSGVSQSGFSSGFQLGFIKDMPINKERNWAIGLGLGISSNSINQNLRIIETNNKYSYEVLANGSYSKNKFSQQLIEVPFEIRWRTSTPLSSSFWRVYTGFKLGYLISSSSKYKDANEEVKLTNIKAFNNWQYGLTLGIGYDSWNAYMHYNINSIFDAAAQVNSKSIDMNLIKIGIMFYIL